MSSSYGASTIPTTWELNFIKRLFSHLDEITLGEVMVAMDEILDEANREAVKTAQLHARLDAIDAWRQTIRRNTSCWATLGSLALLETHERVAPKFRDIPLSLKRKGIKASFRHTLEG
ncbi:hypothetical protein ACX3O0_15155 [Homoserinimonas sp. A447]